MISNATTQTINVRDLVEYVFYHQDTTTAAVFANLIKEIRRKHGFTHKKLAALLGISEQS